MSIYCKQVVFLTCSPAAIDPPAVAALPPKRHYIRDIIQKVHERRINNYQ